MATKICGVYSLTNIITGKSYIGSGKNVLNRKASHFWQLRSNRHKNHLLQADFDQHGADSFQFDVLYTAPYAHIRGIEQSLIDSGDYVYNLARKATGGGAQNERTIERMKAAQMGKTHTAETIEKLRCRPKEVCGSFIGYYHTPSGTFPSSHEAADAMGGVMNYTTIKRWCRNPDKPFSVLALRKTAYLQSLPGDIIGKTPRQIGFSFTPRP